MARQPHSQGHFSYQNVEIFRNEENTLGIGSYGAVYRAKCDELPCAAKCLHPVFFQYNDPGMLDAIGKFEQECRFLSMVRHPNIIQYLGVIPDPDSGRPILLMELMDESLTRFLEHQSGSLLYHMQINFAFDIALALAYLHSNGIVHRDLSSNNVLLIAGSRAKVTDFGMSKLIDVNPRMTPLTQCPGTLAYMAPEALLPHPRYTGKLDCFSDGVLMIQIVTQNFPNPGPNMRLMEAPWSPTGVIHVPVSEVERRRNDIDLIDPTHSLLPIALDCLKDKENERPSAKELCHYIVALKEAPQYEESVQQASERGTGGQSAATEGERQGRETTEQLQRQNQDLQEQLHHKDEHILEQNEQLQEKELQIQQRDATISAQESQIQDLQQQLQSQNDQLQNSSAVIVRKQAEIQQLRQEFQQTIQQQHVIEARERKLRELNQQLQEKEQMTTRILQTLSQKERMVRDPEERPDRDYQELNRVDSSRRADRESIQLKWREGRAPCKMNGDAAVVEGSVAYFKPGQFKTVYAYDSEQEEWSQLPECTHFGFSLAVVKGLVTTIGGCDYAGNINTLLSLTGNGRDRKWTELFPPMPTRRSNTAAVRNGKHLLVAGGYSDGGRVTTVEMMDTENLQWYTATNLPYPFVSATATICGDSVYLLGGLDQEGKTKSVLSCSMTALLQSCQPQPLAHQLQMTLAQRVWNRVADVPAYYSTCATLRGELVAVGGHEPGQKNHKITAVYQYSPSTNLWQVISHMNTARDQCLVAVFANDSLMIVGGYTDKWGMTDVVEVASIL